MMEGGFHVRIAMQCIAHRIELGVSKAIKDHTRLRHLNDVLIFLYEQYHYTPKTLRELRVLGEALEEKVLKPSMGAQHFQGYAGKGLNKTTQQPLRRP